jgi:hypothetical protein
MSRDYLTEFRSLFEELRQHPAFEITAEEIAENYEEGLGEYSVEDLRRSYGFDIPNDYANYVDVSIHTHLRFVYYIDEAVSGGGEFHLRPLYDTLISTKDPELWYEGMAEQEIEFLKYFRIFDDHPDAGDFKMAAFHLMPGICPPRIPDIYFYDRGKYWKMNIDYGGYLDALLGLFGVSNWQYLFCDINFNEPKFENLYEELNTRLSQLSGLFPNRNFESYRGMLQRRAR